MINGETSETALSQRGESRTLSVKRREVEDHPEIHREKEAPVEREP
jgi:hypothetical protein